MTVPRVVIALTVIAFACMIASICFEQKIKEQERDRWLTDEAVRGVIDERFNWAIQGQDGAIDGCPGQYHQYAEINNGHEVLIGCWGRK